MSKSKKIKFSFEKERIIANGGQIYQTKTSIKIEENSILKSRLNDYDNQNYSSNEVRRSNVKLSNNSKKNTKNNLSKSNNSSLNEASSISLVCNNNINLKMIESCIR